MADLKEKAIGAPQRLDGAGRCDVAGDKAPRSCRVIADAKPVLVAFALVLVTLALLNGLVASLGHSPQFSFALTGSFLLYLATRPAKAEIIATVLTGISLRWVYGATFGVSPYFGSAWISLAGFLGIASLIVLAYGAIRKNRFSAFGIAAFFPFVWIMVGFILPVGNRLSRVTFDGHLLAVDGALGFQPSFVLGRLLSGDGLSWDLTTTVYYMLPLAVALLCAAHQLAGHTGEVRRLLCLFGLMSVVGFSLYAVCPATGPIYAFREWFPWRAPQLSDIPMAPLRVPMAPRNAMPSLHFSAALLVFWNTSSMRKASRIAAGLFLAGTAFATLALGEHYLIDLVVAFPFSLVFQAAFTDSGHGNSALRRRTVLASAGLLVGWLIVLRFWARPLAAWPAVLFVACILTLGFSILARRELSQVRSRSKGHESAPGCKSDRSVDAAGLP